MDVLPLSPKSPSRFLLLNIFRLLLHVFYYAGIFRLWNMLRRNSVTIVMIHGVMDEDDPTSQWHAFRSYISRKRLDNTLKALSQNYEFISIDDALDRLCGLKPLDKHYCVITFDDGLRNNLTHALPILRRYSAPSIMYVVTGQVSIQEPFWFDRLDYAIQQSIGLTDHIQVFDKLIEFKCSTREEQKALLLEIKDSAYASGHSSSEINKELIHVAKRLEEVCGKSLLDIYPNDPWSKIMCWEDIILHSKDADITFGSHTVDHSILDGLTAKEVSYQLATSKKALEDHSHKPCTHFCYPNGNTHPEASKLLDSNGYRSAVCVTRGVNTRKNFDRYHLKRFSIPTDGDKISMLADMNGLRDFILKFKFY